MKHISIIVTFIGWLLLSAIALVTMIGFLILVFETDWFDIPEKLIEKM